MLQPGTTFSTCGVPFTSGAGRQTVTASYAGDKSDKKSVGETTVAVLRPTRAAVACPPARTSASREITCTATVDDTGSGTATAPTGSVTFAAVPAGTFAASGVCTLSPAGSHARCKLSYRSLAGRQTVSVSYAGDAVHAVSSASTTIAGRYATRVGVSCAPSPVPAGHTTSCEAIVADVGAGTAPTGSVSFRATPSGSFASSGTCALTSSGKRRSCKLDYTPTGGEQTVTATYRGDTGHEPSHGVTKVSTPRSTAVTVTCTPARVSAEQPIACTAVVRNTGAGKAFKPTGRVSFSALPAGSFVHGHSCTLASAACKVTYTPLAGRQTITATYAGDRGHDQSHSAVTVTYKVPTSSSVKCVLQHTSTISYVCTATVTNTAAAVSAPTGTVTFSSDTHGSFRPGKTCTLKTAGASSNCTVTYLPTPGSQTVSATYGGDSAHGPSVSRPTPAF
ncbi:MAG: large repetitive protein [Solirubrobacteraceae bacterium]|nr:large repetitive protein [Solirubrobacteraceae bacterium]